MTDITIRETWTAPAARDTDSWLRRALRRAEAAARLGSIRAHSRGRVIARHFAPCDGRQMADVGVNPRIRRDRDDFVDSILRHSFR